MTRPKGAGHAAANTAETEGGTPTGTGRSDGAGQPGRSPTPPNGTYTIVPANSMFYTSFNLAGPIGTAYSKRGSRKLWFFASAQENESWFHRYADADDDDPAMLIWEFEAPVQGKSLFAIGLYQLGDVEVVPYAQATYQPGPAVGSPLAGRLLTADDFRRWTS